MKLVKHYFSEISKSERKNIIEQCCELFGHDIVLNNDASFKFVDLEVATGDGVLYDLRVFDPYHRTNFGSPIYIYPDGWSNWLCEYRDPAGHDIDEIFADYDGETQD